MWIFRLKDSHCWESELNVPMLLLLAVRGFRGMVGRAARAGFVPWDTGGLGFTGPPGELPKDAALWRVAGSGFKSPRGWVFSGEPGSDFKTKPVEDLFSGAKHIKPYVPIAISRYMCGWRVNSIYSSPDVLLSGLSGLDDWRRQGTNAGQQARHFQVFILFSCTAIWNI